MSGIKSQVLYYMPELPEVETIRRDIDKQILNLPITSVDIFSDRSINISPGTFITDVVGNSIVRAERKGKYLALQLSSEQALVIHLKMSGQIIIKGNTETGHGFTKVSPDELPDKHTRVQLTFVDGTIMFFNDMRRFGYMHLVSQAEKEQIFNRIGRDVYLEDIDLSFLKQKKTSVKAALLQQDKVSGIGNIYADEICFRAGVLPQQIANTLSDTEITRLEQVTATVIAQAVKERGTSFGLYVDGQGKQGNYVNFLQVYKRGGEPCMNDCGGSITKIRVAGRGTHFCSNCQK